MVETQEGTRINVRPENLLARPPAHEVGEEEGPRPPKRGRVSAKDIARQQQILEDGTLTRLSSATRYDLLNDNILQPLAEDNLTPEGIELFKALTAREKKPTLVESARGRNLRLRLV